MDVTDNANASEKVEGVKANAGNVGGEHMIQNAYTFWYHRRRGDKKNVDYNESTKQIATFASIESFWQIYDHIVRPNEFKVTTDYHLFKKDIGPMWEDEANKNGGKWMVRLKKGLASRYWEELVLAMIGEQFDVGQEICGAVVSVRNSEDIISIWNKNCENKEATYKIVDQMRKILKLPNFITIEYKKHKEALGDGSSFRNASWNASGTGNFKGNGVHEKRQGGAFGAREGGQARNTVNKSGDRAADRSDRSDGHQSTGNPARDAAYSKAKEERSHVPVISSWVKSGSRPVWGGAGGAPQARGSGDGKEFTSSPRGDATYKRASGGILGTPPTLRSDGKPRKDGENPNVWRRTGTENKD